MLRSLLLVRASAALLIITLCISNAQRTVDTSTGGQSCVVPAYSRPLHEVNVTAETEALLLAEGRCYLACLRDGTHFEVCLQSIVDVLSTK